MRDHLVFYINGRRHAARGNDVGLTLSDYLRQGRGSSPTDRLTGTKIACAEGDCGACTVLLGRPTPDASALEYSPIDSCIAFVFQLDRTHVVTVEALAEKCDLTNVQAAMVNHYGSQCGFCTPGFVMALHGIVEQRRRIGRNEKLSDPDLKLGLSGNLCRCTGYTQILEAGRAIDMPSVISCVDRFDSANILSDFASLALHSVEVNARLSLERNGSAICGASQVAADLPPTEIYVPATVDDLLARRAARPQSTLVAGATDLGVLFNHRKVTVQSALITSNIPELQELRVVDNQVEIGAAVTLSRLAEFLRDLVPEYHHLLERFGGPQIRNLGTLVGNFANASPIADSIPFHMVAESTIEVASSIGRRQIPIADFFLGYKKIDLLPTEVILTVRMPLPGPNVRLKLYKVSRRRDLDISTVTAAFWIETDADGTIGVARIAVGGVGPKAVRLRRAESLLVGRRFDLPTMQSVGKQACAEISPISDVRGSAHYRSQLIENLFSKFYHDLSTTPAFYEPTCPK